ncbi:metabotropic glutamate receptor 7 [Lasius niger]|uniref:Metabotropic glutamate receptor 7 n=1 Tax=Lasius niger TaxID=67767 RepID=A0A0J7KGF5_LASNI|nr:metabotropic glutamate receptor 7 [Lasius niger]
MHYWKRFQQNVSFSPSALQAFEELEELLGKYNICIAIKEKLVKDSGVAEEIAYDNIVLKLLTKPRARDFFVANRSQFRQARPYALFYALIDSYRILYNLDSHRNRRPRPGARHFIGIFFNKSLGLFAFEKMSFCRDKIKPNGENYHGCIIFGSDQEVAGVMRAVKRCNATGAFSWIGSDGWSARGLVSNGNEPEVEGTLSVQPQANQVKGFKEYFLNLTVENNRRNPWFVEKQTFTLILEFWEDHFKCRYPNASRTPYNKKYTTVCTTEERLTEQNTAFENQLQFVSDAVMAFAYAFRDMHLELCHGKEGLCDAMKPTKGTKLLQYLRKVDFEGKQTKRFLEDYEVRI